MKTKGKFISVCVLAFAATATAGLQFMVNGKVVQNGDYVYGLGNTIFSIVNDKQETGAFDGGCVVLSGPARFGEVTIIPGMLPGVWSIVDISADLGKPAMFISWDLPAVDPVKAGKLVDFEILSRVGDWSTVTFSTNVNLEPIFSVTLSEPEPATLALLGLGAMMIRRKRPACPRAGSVIERRKP